MNDQIINSPSETTIVPQRKQVYKWYLILSIIYSTLFLVLKGYTVIGTIFTKSPDIAFMVGSLFLPTVSLWPLFNIVMLIIFLVKKIEKRALWIPILYIFTWVLGFLFSLILVQIINQGLFSILSIIDPIIPIITLILAIKLLKSRKAV